MEALVLLHTVIKIVKKKNQLKTYWNSNQEAPH